MDAEQPIVIIKKKGGHGGHHGGAWKVAYADFVTAMMSLFIVLWLLSSTSKQTQQEIAGYFRDPKGVASKKGANPKPLDEKQKEKKDEMAALKKDLMRAIEQINALNKVKKQIEITVTDEGLRIELLEDEKGTFFELGSAQPTPVMVELLKVLSGQLKDLPNKISIEGHTDATPYTRNATYGNWELSSDRANVSRRMMQNDGVRMDQVSQVRGFADQRLRTPDKPFDAANRRISLVVLNLPVEDNDKLAPGQSLAKDGAKADPTGAAKVSSAAMATQPLVGTTAAKPSAEGVH